MRSRKRTVSKPCPCGYICKCHKPKKGYNGILWTLFFFCVVILISVLCIVCTAPNSSVRHIEVNGQDCLVQWHTDGCTSTGACHGHDVAICPKDQI